MELTGEWKMPVGGKRSLGVIWKGDDLPDNVTIASATVTVTPATGLTLDSPVVNTAKDGVTFWATAATAGTYVVVVTAILSDSGKNVEVGVVTVGAASALTTAATNALVTVEMFEAYYGGAVSKTRADLIINGVSQEFDRFCARILKQATYTNLCLDGNGEKHLPLPSWPAASLGTVTEDGTLLTEGATADYLLYTSDDCAYLYRVSGRWLKRPKAVLLSTVLLGHSPIPADLTLACLKQCAYEYQRQALKTWGETSRSVEGGSVGMVEPGLLLDVQEVLKRYRSYGL